MLCDLRPYVCTYEDCSDADQQYDSFTQWLNHENNNHRLARECKEHPGEFFQSITSWNDHLASHKLDSSSRSDLASSDIEKGSADEQRYCIFCTEGGVTPEHTSAHLQQLALFALPRSTGLEGDLESDDDASAATVDSSERALDDDLNPLSFSEDEIHPSEAVYGVDYNQVGNMLFDLDPYELAPDKRQLFDDWNVVHNPTCPRELDIELKATINCGSMVTCVKFSPDGGLLACGINHSALIYETVTATKFSEVKLNNMKGDNYVRGVSFDSTATCLAVASGDTIRVT